MSAPPCVDKPLCEINYDWPDALCCNHCSNQATKILYYYRTLGDSNFAPTCNEHYDKIYKELEDWSKRRYHGGYILPPSDDIDHIISNDCHLNKDLLGPWAHCTFTHGKCEKCTNDADMLFIPVVNDHINYIARCIILCNDCDNKYKY